MHQMYRMYSAFGVIPQYYRIFGYTENQTIRHDEYSVLTNIKIFGETGYLKKHNKSNNKI